MTELFANEKALFGILLIVVSTCFVITGKATVDQWFSFGQWIFTAYAGATAAHQVAQSLSTKHHAAPAPSAPPPA